MITRNNGGDRRRRLSPIVRSDPVANNSSDTVPHQGVSSLSTCIQNCALTFSNGDPFLTNFLVTDRVWNLKVAIHWLLGKNPLAILKEHFWGYENAVNCEISLKLLSENFDQIVASENREALIIYYLKESQKIVSDLSRKD